MPESKPDNHTIQCDLIFTDINGDEIARTKAEFTHDSPPRKGQPVSATITGYKYFGTLSRVEVMSFDRYYLLARIFGKPTPQAADQEGIL